MGARRGRVAAEPLPTRKGEEGGLAESGAGPWTQSTALAGGVSKEAGSKNSTKVEQVEEVTLEVLKRALVLEWLPPPLPQPPARSKRRGCSRGTWGGVGSEGEATSLQEE